ncbi:DUF6069 family protein [Amycolatopsis albispora]|uniref:Uncharacterized protein n=1 Tax=Amycolatopsis albispora TaxID=1804986 RepID=A0A344L4J1_9PSEU|nr:DUF6069 family protein [Amycolatopsis albispora]AXB42965.1 hypothetical protein A4R43_10755 [Amycolatopsis albispora]
MTTSAAQETPAGSKALTRVGGIVGAAVAVSLIWTLAVPVLGVDLTVTSIGATAPQTVDLVTILIATVAVSLVGWGLLALLERRGKGRIWTFVAAGVMVLSLASPLLATGPLDARLTLALLHIVVGAVVIPAFRRGVPA